MKKEPDPKFFREAATHKHWLKVMNGQLDVLESNNTWETTTLPKDKHAIRCKWL